MRFPLVFAFGRIPRVPDFEVESGRYECMHAEELASASGSVLPGILVSKNCCTESRASPLGWGKTIASWGNAVGNGGKAVRDGAKLSTIERGQTNPA